MRTRALVACTLLIILVILLLSAAVQAKKYTEVNAKVNASDISKHIENGEDIYLENCSIVGELNATKIKLKPIRNPRFEGFLNSNSSAALFTKALYREVGLSDNLHVIETNIKITNSTFENGFNFSNILFDSNANFNATKFNSDAYFYGATFNSDANFYGAEFNSDADFGEVTFNSDANFYGAEFNSDAHFGGVTFNSDAHFYGAEFNSNADFHSAKFNSDADFYGATFNSYIDFPSAEFNGIVCFAWAKFNSDANFGGVTFNSPAYFYGAKFNSSASFEGPETSDKIRFEGRTDGKICEFFMESYNAEARYADADNIYYTYRKNSQEEKSLTDMSKWFDTLSWVTCGYGTNLSYTIFWMLFFIVAFAIKYKNPSVSLVKSKMKTNTPGIYRESDVTKEKTAVSFLECLYFSINTFTTLGSEDWHPQDNLRKWVTIEGFLGYVMLAILTATLMHLLMRQ